mgnify:CR=1 FL=1
MFPVAVTVASAEIDIEKYPTLAAGAVNVLLVMVAVEPATTANPLVAVMARSRVLNVHPVTVSAVKEFVATALRLIPRDVLLNWQLLNVQAPVWTEPASKKKAWFALARVPEPVNEQLRNEMLEVVPFMFTLHENGSAVPTDGVVFENLMPSNSRLFTPLSRRVQLFVAAVALANVTFTGSVFAVADLNVTLFVVLVPVIAVIVTCSV